MGYIGQVQFKSADIKRQTVTSSTSATHTLNWSPNSEQSLIITINGVKQHDSAYTISGTTLTLASALVATDEMEIVGFQSTGNVTTPADGTVGTTTIEDGAVTDAKIDGMASSKLSGALPAIDGSSLTGLSSSGLNSVQVFTASGTWTKPSEITKVIIEVQGAGGSGSFHTNANNLHYGVAGAYAIKLLDVSSISSSTITIGSGGAGVTSTGAGNSGGNSSWADGTNTITGNGGSGGSGSAYTGSAGSTASGGDINISSAGTGTESTRTSNSGSKWGFQGAYKDAVTGTAYPDATGYGAGGGPLGGSSGTSGAGAGGIVIVWEYK